MEPDTALDTSAWEETEYLRNRVAELEHQVATIGPTLATTQAELAAHVDTGMTCPACGQFAKVYRRSINSSMARSLITLWNSAGLRPAYLPDVVGSRSREESKLRYWGLVVEAPLARPDGGHAGWWKVTNLGADWVQGRVKVPKYAYIYNGERQRLAGTPVGIDDALGNHFNLAELLHRSTP